MCSSSTSKPARTRVRAEATYARVIRVRSRSVAERTSWSDSGLGIRLAASAWTPFDRPLATGPACPTWPAIPAPVAWTASASRASPASVGSPTTTWAACVRPSGATAR